MMNALDLGCGPNPRNPFAADLVYGVDLQTFDNPLIKVADLAIQPIPFDDCMFEYVTAYDFLEHIPRQLYLSDSQKGGVVRLYPFVQVMNEIWRVMKLGGTFMSSTPAFPHAAAFQDPTHVNYVTPDTFGEYFDEFKTWGKNYGFKGKFSIKAMDYFGPHLVVTMTKLSNDIV
jgi:SAM-dependent methyltransferase